MINDIVTGQGLEYYNNSCASYISHDGILMWDHNSQSMVVVDQNGARSSLRGNAVSINLNNETLSVIDWAKRKMIQEQNLEKLCDDHPGLKDLKEKFEVMLALVRKECQ